jgi:uncharacterized protein (TIGR00251 family)
MKIFVKAKPEAREEKIEKISDDHFAVFVKEPAKQGRANKAIIKKLAEYFGVFASQVILKSGFSSRNKIFEIKK